jgi:hypothetical protein
MATNNNGTDVAPLGRERLSLGLELVVRVRVLVVRVATAAARGRGAACLGRRQRRQRCPRRQRRHSGLHRRRAGAPFLSSECLDKNSRDPGDSQSTQPPHLPRDPSAARPPAPAPRLASARFCSLLRRRDRNGSGTATQYTRGKRGHALTASPLGALPPRAWPCPPGGAAAES